MAETIAIAVAVNVALALVAYWHKRRQLAAMRREINALRWQLHKLGVPYYEKPE